MDNDEAADIAKVLDEYDLSPSAKAAITAEIAKHREEVHEFIERFVERGTENVVRKRRDDQGLTQVELAKRSGIPQSVISLLEHGLHPSPQQMEALAGALDTTVEKLFPTELWSVEDAQRWLHRYDR